MTGYLWVTALLMGLAGSPHCISMCAVGCGAAARACTGRAIQLKSLAWLLLGRSLSYVLVGCLAAASIGMVRDLSESVRWIKPFWTIMQVGILLLGLSLMVLGRQPRWMEHLAVGIQHWVEPKIKRHLSHVPEAMRLFMAGMLWVALPCGLLYSALAVASLGSTPLEGGVIMLMFSIGGAVALLMSLGIWQRVYGHQIGMPSRFKDLSSRWWSGNLSIRLAGLLLAATSAWALGHGLWHPFLVWCGLA